MALFIPNPLLASEIAKEAKPGVLQVAEEGAQDARDHAPVDTGEMQASIAVEETDDGAQVTVGTDHWVFPEFGTIFQAAQPFMRTIIDNLGLHR